MTHTLLWITVHRNWFLALLGAFLWAFANYWYLRRDIARWKRNARMRAWSVDMATKTSKGSIKGPAAGG